MPATRPIFLLTDFGLGDPYVGTLRAVIAGIAPSSPIHDLGHELPPQDLRAGAYALMCSGPYLPGGAVICAVVDPGVGSDRRAVAAELTLPAGRVVVVAPDNGLLTPLLDASHTAAAVLLDRAAYHLSPVSATFHGRDVFAPVAAHLAAGAALGQVGSPLPASSLVRLAWPEAKGDGDGVQGEVLVIDRFGNLITNVPRTLLDRQHSPEAKPPWTVLLEGAPPLPVLETFSSVPEGEAVAYLGSSGSVEVAVRNGDAATRFGAVAGTPVQLVPGADASA